MRVLQIVILFLAMASIIAAIDAPLKYAHGLVVTKKGIVRAFFWFEVGDLLLVLFGMISAPARFEPASALIMFVLLSIVNVCKYAIEMRQLKMLTNRGRRAGQQVPD